MKAVLSRGEDRKIFAGAFCDQYDYPDGRPVHHPHHGSLYPLFGTGSEPDVCSRSHHSAMGISSHSELCFLGKIGRPDWQPQAPLLYFTVLLKCIGYSAHAQTPFQLGLIRFLYGFGTGALLPSVNSL